MFIINFYLILANYVHTLTRDTLFWEVIMSRTTLLGRMEKGLTVLVGVTLLMTGFQALGLLIYGLTVWPTMFDQPPLGITVLVGISAIAGVVRSLIWIRIYLTSAKLLRAAKNNGGPLHSFGPLIRLLVVSCILDVCTLPSIFLMDAFSPFAMSSVLLGLIQMAVLLFPQVSGVAALILAYLLRQFDSLLQERGTLQQELELTI
jgi:divalent metal cation (Fe/Co/Zn/Cd) transporter